MTPPVRSVPRGLPAPTSASIVIQRVLAIAKSQAGYREGPNNDNAYGKWYGYNHVAWCAEFASWAAFVAAIPETVIPKHMYTPTGWNWFKARNRDVTTPAPGDLFYVYGNVAGESKPRVHHVGFVVSYDGRYITTAEGNTNNTGSASGNGVYIGRRDVQRGNLRFVRPNYAYAVVKPPPVTSTPPKQGVEDMPLTQTDLAAIRTIVKEELKAQDLRLWGEGGSAGEFMQRTDKSQGEQDLQLDRIEADTDDGDGPLTVGQPTN